ncbi:hypothetical protein DSECCO2_583300 [anaerobic digester metagenome]
MSAKVFGRKLYRHRFVGVGGFGQCESDRHHRVDADGLFMGRRNAPAVFGRGNQGDAAGLLEFQLAAVLVKIPVRQLGKHSGQSVFQS